jgi:hypothetical protein
MGDNRLQHRAAATRFSRSGLPADRRRACSGIKNSGKAARPLSLRGLLPHPRNRTARADVLSLTEPTQTVGIALLLLNGLMNDLGALCAALKDTGRGKAGFPVCFVDDKTA